MTQIESKTLEGTQQPYYEIHIELLPFPIGNK